MATALEVADAHRVAQNRLTAALALLIVRYFRSLQGPQVDIEAAGRAWLAAVLPVLAAAHGQSARLAAAYWREQHGLNVGEVSRYAPSANVLGLNYEQARRSLAYTGIVHYQDRLERGMDPGRAWELSAADAAGSAVRLAGDGGREALIEAFTDETLAIGWSRATRANPCYFCAMLASRGPVYKGDSFDQSDARFSGGDILSEVKVHDSCGCFLVPVYDRFAPEPGNNRAFAELWSASTGGTSGQDAVKAFRQAYNEKFPGRH